MKLDLEKIRRAVTTSGLGALETGENFIPS